MSHKFSFLCLSLFLCSVKIKVSISGFTICYDPFVMCYDRVLPFVRICFYDLVIFRDS